MADIRQSALLFDDFERPDEDPIQNTPAHPWLLASFTVANVQIDGGILKGTGGGDPCWAYWNADAQSDDGGEVPEIWSHLGAGSYSFPFGTRMGLMSSGGFGYGFLQTGGFGSTLRRYTGGGAFTAITITGGDGVFTDTGAMQLMRLTSTHVEVWRSAVGDDTTWTLTASAADIIYRDNLLMYLGGTGNEDGWGDLGGGPRRAARRAQIYRIIQGTRATAT